MGSGRGRAIGFFGTTMGSAMLALCLSSAPAAAVDQVGPSTGLPLPRYVSLKSDRVNLREGPSKDHRTIWVFQKAGLPVEITAESDTWRRIRDSEGTEGWVLQSLLSGRRTALVKPWAKGEVLALHGKPTDKSDEVARMQAGALANVRRCESGWCRIFGDGFDGYLQQANLWGVYPNEQVQ